MTRKANQEQWLMWLRLTIMLLLDITSVAHVFTRLQHFPQQLREGWSAFLNTKGSGPSGGVSPVPCGDAVCTKPPVLGTLQVSPKLFLIRDFYLVCTIKPFLICKLLSVLLAIPKIALSLRISLLSALLVALVIVSSSELQGMWQPGKGPWLPIPNPWAAAASPNPNCPKTLSFNRAPNPTLHAVTTGPACFQICGLLHSLG